MSYKRCLLFFLIVIAVLSFPLFASDLLSFTMDVVGSAVDAYANGGRPPLYQLEKHLDSLNVGNMTLEQRREIYEAYHVESGNAIFRNVVIGFGTGSKRQGDGWGSFIGALGDGIGFGLLTASAACFLIDLMTFQSFGAATGGQEVGTLSDSPLMEITKILAISGGVVIGVNRLVGIIPPLVYSARYNSRLRGGLGLDKKLNLAMAPAVNPYNGDLGVTMVAGISF